MRITIKSKTLENELKRLADLHGLDVGEMAVSMIRNGMDFPEANLRRMQAVEDLKAKESEVGLLKKHLSMLQSIRDGHADLAEKLSRNNEILTKRQRAAMDLIHAYTGEELREV